MPDQPPPTHEDAIRAVITLTEYSVLHAHDWLFVQSGLVVGALLSIATMAPEVNDPSWYAAAEIDRLMEECARHDALCGGC